MEDRHTTLLKSSEQFKKLYPEFSKIVREVFPNAEEVFEFKMHGFKIKITKDEIRKWSGTMDPNYLQLFLVERINGITFHIWNPKDYMGLENARAELTQIGFKVMRGCIQWNKKAAFPVEELKNLLVRVSKSI